MHLKQCHCGSHVYRINSYYPADSADICANCNHECILCICKPAPGDVTSIQELNRLLEHDQ